MAFLNLSDATSSPMIIGFGCCFSLEPAFLGSCYEETPLLIKLFSLFADVYAEEFDRSITCFFAAFLSRDMYTSCVSLCMGICCSYLVSMEVAILLMGTE